MHPLFTSKIIAIKDRGCWTNGPFDPLNALSGARARLAGPVVFTNGVFDVLHRGHVSYLEAARALGGSLVVALNTDASARRLGKGPGRPLNNEADRAALIAALASVDAVTFFEEDTPLETIDASRPDILVKGGDYDMGKLMEAQLVHSYGGQALALNFVDGYSTTALVTKIQEQGQGQGQRHAPSQAETDSQAISDAALRPHGAAAGLAQSHTAEDERFATLPSPPYCAVIFSSKRTPGDHGYGAASDRMLQLVHEQPGFLGLESARDAQGFGITVAYFESEGHAAAWKQHAEHRRAQSKGQSDWYRHYELRVAQVTRAYGAKPA